MLFCFLYPQIPLFEDPNTLASQPNITMDFLHEASIIGFTGTESRDAPREFLVWVLNFNHVHDYSARM